jgi:hypothetical protein
MKEDLPALFWSFAELGSGLEALARKSELQPSPAQVPHPPSSLASLDNTARAAMLEPMDRVGGRLVGPGSRAFGAAL